MSSTSRHATARQRAASPQLKRAGSQRSASPSSRQLRPASSSSKASNAGDSRARDHSWSSNGALSEKEVRSALEALGIKGSASLAEIKRAWKRQALSSHPDKVGAGNEKFLAIQSAHEALQRHAKDPQRVKSAQTARRANFDRILEEYEAKKRGEPLRGQQNKAPQTDRGPGRGQHLSRHAVRPPAALGFAERPRAKSQDTHTQSSSALDTQTMLDADSVGGIPDRPAEIEQYVSAASSSTDLPIEQRQLALQIC